MADAEAHEGGGAAITFAVSLSPAVTHAVTVYYATADGMAQADADYTATSGTLTFAPGETAQTVSVPIFDDSHDDDGETFSLRLANAQGADIADGEATGTIYNVDSAQQAWIARFRRTVADQMLEAVNVRMTAPPNAGRELTLGGHRVGLDGAAGVAQVADDAGAARHLAGLYGADDAERRLELQGRGMTARELLLGSPFSLTAVEERTRHYTLWGRGEVSRFDGAADGLTLEGELASAFLDADWSRERLTAGLIVGHSRGDGGHDGASDSGTLSSTLTGLYPWLRHALTERIGTPPRSRSRGCRADGDADPEHA